MHYLLASILASTSILVLFRWMQNSKAVTRHAIVVSYLGSVIAGMLLFDVDWSLVTRGWFLPAAAEGVGFYVVFRMIALATQRSGITVASIATKMSVVIPTLIGIVALGESVSIFSCCWIKIQRKYAIKSDWLGIASAGIHLHRVNRRQFKTLSGVGVDR